MVAGGAIGALCTDARERWRAYEDAEDVTPVVTQPTIAPTDYQDNCVARSHGDGAGNVNGRDGVRLRGPRGASHQRGAVGRCGRWTGYCVLHRGSEWLTSAHVVGDATTVDLDSGTDAVSATVVGNDTRQAGPTGKGAVTQFYARFDLDSVRGIRQVGKIFEHVLGRPGPDVDLSLANRARNEAGHDDATQRIVSENVSNLGVRRGGVRVSPMDLAPDFTEAVRPDDPFQ